MMQTKIFIRLNTHMCFHLIKQTRRQKVTQGDKRSNKREIINNFIVLEHSTEWLGYTCIIDVLDKVLIQQVLKLVQVQTVVLLMKQDLLRCIQVRRDGNV